MPPQVALVLTACVIVYLFSMEPRRPKGLVSAAIWIPFFWMFFAGSRYLSLWIDLGAPAPTAEVYTDGSPLDRAVFVALISAGLVVLAKRRMDWRSTFLSNAWVLAYFAFGVLSILWSDYPFVTAKRLVKAFGNVVMALVVLTETDAAESCSVLLRRLAFVMIPLSFLFCKYYPDLGRAYHMGEPMYTGVTYQKNSLGLLCMVFGIYFSWELLKATLSPRNKGSRLHPTVYLTMGALIIWLLAKSGSATSLAGFILGIGMLVVARMLEGNKQPSRIIAAIFVAVILAGALEYLFQISTLVLVVLGRKPDLTTRVPMWQGLLASVIHPLFGVGFESYWLGSRLRTVWSLADVARLNNAHNGYLETYLSAGAIGLALFIAGIIRGLVKLRRRLFKEYQFGLLLLVYVVVIVIYNWTEATFHGVSLLWVLLLIGILEPSCSTSRESARAVSEFQPHSAYTVRP